MNKRLLLFIVFGAVTLFFSTTAIAILGEHVDSVESDRKALSAVRHATVEQTEYTVHEIVSSRVTVREYVSSSGIVFAIAWSGHFPPDLNQLLGTYFPEYTEAAKQVQRTPGRRHLSVTTENVIVETSGRMRAWRGRAYAPDLIPTGVNINEIQ